LAERLRHWRRAWKPLAASFILSLALVWLSSCSTQPLPNVVLISIDTLRPDRLGCYGGPRPTSPAIDELAKIGILFQNAFTPSPWTVPGHASMLTGMYPSSLSSNPVDFRMYRQGRLLSSMLQDAGFDTGAVTGGGFVSSKLGVSEGFDFFKDEGTAEDAVEWIRQREERPFFLFFHTFEVHAPFTDKRFAKEADAGTLAGIYQDKKLGEIHHRVACEAAELTASEKEYLVALYDGGIARADEMVAELIHSLKSRRLFDRTIVIITSDHGEEFWEHTGRGAFHGHSLYNELLRVPLIWLDPEIPHGQVSDQPVSILDIVPTLVSRLDLEEEGPFDGLDIGPILEGHTEESIRRRFLFGEAVYTGPIRYSVRSIAAKLIRTPEPAKQIGPKKSCLPVKAPAENELFLREDPGEITNRFAEYPDLAKELQIHLHRHIERPVKIRNSQETIDQETIKKLRSLGYLN